MGKKTNWTTAEDLTLCRAWLNASEAVLPPPTGDQKAATFWNVVYHLFHSELETSMERPHNGLKIRWTRINRDVQKFALIYAQMQSLAAELKGASAAATGVSATLGDSLESDAHAEQQCIDDAKEQFFKAHETKFPFEACWKLLRYSPKWVQLLANSPGVSALHHSNAAAVAHLFLGVDGLPRIDDSPAAVATTASVATDMNGSGISNDSNNSTNKRRALTLLESCGRSSIQQLQDITTNLVDGLKRQNELLEEQNAIALFQFDTDVIDDDDARAYFELLRRRCVKRMRASMTQPSAAVSAPPIAAAATTMVGADVSSGAASSLNDALAASAEKGSSHVIADASRGLDQRSTGVV